MTKTTKESNGMITITISDGLIRASLDGTEALWSYEISGQGKTTGEATVNLTKNLLILKEKLEEL